MLSALERRAVTAACTVASQHGLNSDEATVIYSGSNVLIHLRPAPIIARVMTGTVALHDNPRRWLEQEVSVLEFLAPSALAVSPSPLIAPGPFSHDGLWMTLVEWVPGVEPAPEGHARTYLDDAGGLGRRLRDLHDQLRPFNGELGGLRELRADIERLLGQVQPSDPQQSDAIASLHEQLDMLGTVVFESSVPAQTLHGDASLRNLLRTPRGFLWNDFEDTFRGPVHWDLASFVGSLRIHGASELSVQEMLEGYGWDDEQGLTPFFAAQDAYDEIWRMYDQQRRRSGP